MKLYREAQEGEQAIAFPVVEVEAQAVPWCAEHDAPIDYLSRDREYVMCKGRPMLGVCRLEEPARHYVIETIRELVKEAKERKEPC